MLNAPPENPSLPSVAGDLSALNFNLEHSIGYLLRRTMVGFGGEVERHMEPLGLTEAQWKPMLRLLLAGDDGLNVATLARTCMLDAGAMTRTLDRLEAKQLCRRVRSLEDRRVVQLELTPEGRTAAGQVPDVLVRVQGAVLDGFSAEEVTALRGMLQRMLGNLEGMAASPQATGAGAGVTALQDNNN